MEIPAFLGREEFQDDGLGDIIEETYHERGFEAVKIFILLPQHVPLGINYRLPSPLGQGSQGCLWTYYQH